jgi:hypothetical protein
MNVEFQAVLRLQVDVSQLVEWLCASGLQQVAYRDDALHIAVAYHDGRRSLSATNIRRGNGPSHLTTAVEQCRQTGSAVGLIAWTRGNPFHDNRGDELVVTVAGNDDVHLKVNAPAESFINMPGFAVALADRFPCNAAGCWTPLDPPSWSQPRFWVRRLEEPFVPGPLSLVIAPPEANRRLLGDPDASTRAIGYWPVSDGAGVWQLSRDARGPNPADTLEWFGILRRHGLLDEASI